MRTLVHVVYLDLQKMPKKYKQMPGTVRICGRFIPFDGWAIIKPAVVHKRDYAIVKRYFEALAGSYRRKEQLITPPFIIWRVK